MFRKIGIWLVENNSKFLIYCGIGIVLSIIINMSYAINTSFATCLLAMFIITGLTIRWTSPNSRALQYYQQLSWFNNGNIFAIIVLTVGTTFETTLVIAMYFLLSAFLIGIEFGLDARIVYNEKQNFD